MAQETSGTISKTILKNEMLPMLLNEQKRADRAYAYDQQAKRKAAELAAKQAAELAAKQAAEDAKFRPEIGSTEGGLFMPQLQELNKSDIDQTVAGFSNPNASLQQKYQYKTDLDRKINERNSWQKYTEGNIKNQFPELQRYYNVSEADIPTYAQSFKADPSIFSVNHAEEFSKKIKQDPNRVKWRDIGTNLFKTIGSDKYSFTNSLGQREVIEGSNLFTPEETKDSITGRKITARRINGQIATEVAMSDPEVRGIVTNFTDLRIPELVKDPAIVQAATAKGVELKDYATDVATSEAMNRLYANMGGVNYTQNIQTEEAKAKSKASGEKQAQFTSGNAPSTSIVYAGRSEPKPGLPKGQVLYDTISWGNVPTYSFPKISLPGGANKKVYPLSNPAEFKEIFTQGPGGEGTYILKQGFDINSAQLVTTYEAKQDIPLKSGGVKKKGKIVSPDFVKTLSPSEQKQYVKGFEAYKVTPEIRSYKYNEDTESYDLSSPQIKTVEMLIPKDYAGELTIAIGNKNQAGNINKPGKPRISGYNKK
jgi:hypothetical protein